MKKILGILVVIFFASSCGKNDGNKSDQPIIQLTPPNTHDIPWIESKTHLEQVFQNYDLVAIGENHGFLQEQEFIIEAIDAAVRHGFSDFVLEFGLQKDQPLLDEFLDSPELRPELVHKILADIPDAWGWPFRGYEQIFIHLWNLKHLPPTKEVRAYIPDTFEFTSDVSDPDKKILLSLKRDADWATKMTALLDQGKKVFFAAGAVHTSLGKKSAVGLIEAQHPGRAFSIRLHAPLDFYSASSPKERAADGEIDRAWIKANLSSAAIELREDSFPGNLSLRAYEYSRTQQPGHLVRIGDDLTTAPDVTIAKLWSSCVVIGIYENLSFSGLIEEMLTPAWLVETNRRIKIVHPEASELDKETMIQVMLKERNPKLSTVKPL